MVNDPRIEQAELDYNQLKHGPRDAEFDQLCRDNALYIAKNFWQIEVGCPYSWTFWQPWVKAYHGERSIGRRNEGLWAAYSWIDQDLKKEMTGR